MRHPGPSPRGHSLITIACLVALCRVTERPSRLKKALENGVMGHELVEAVTHLALCSGWPTAIGILRQVFATAGASTNR